MNTLVHPPTLPQARLAGLADAFTPSPQLLHGVVCSGRTPGREVNGIPVPAYRLVPVSIVSAKTTRRTPPLTFQPPVTSVLSIYSLGSVRFDCQVPTQVFLFSAFPTVCLFRTPKKWAGGRV